MMAFVKGCCVFGNEKFNILGKILIQVVECKEQFFKLKTYYVLLLVLGIKDNKFAFLKLFNKPLTRQ